MDKATGKEIAAVRLGQEKSHAEEYKSVMAEMKSRHERERENLIVACGNATGHKWENISDAQDRYCGITRHRCKWCHDIK